mmetsp:Transcript_53502/g.148325  ORF Transcript_53502/g.148325 Transcript_53502/m.148325 type:complete len:132 (-) Transcript_53502:113-508(-)
MKDRDYEDSACASASAVRVRSFAASSSSSSEPLRRWTCQLCSQTRNTEDMEKCRTCGRDRGHNPEKYRARLQEIRQWSLPSDAALSEEGSGCGESWGLAVGLCMLAAIVSLLAWAFYEDQKEALQPDGLEL